MGFFNRNKKQETAQVSELKVALDTFKKDQSPVGMERFAIMLRKFADASEWVHIGGENDEHGFRVNLISSRGKMFAAMYTDASEIRASAKSVMLTDINKLFEVVFHNDGISGVIIDPDTTSLCLEKGFLLKCLLHSGYPKQKTAGSPQRNWGEGIPQYRESDVMSKGELLNFAMHTVLDNDHDIAAYQFVSACDHLDAVPNLIFEADDHFVFVAVNGYCAMEEPSLDKEKRLQLLALGKKYNASCYYAPAGFGSTDPERFAACLALRGDGFYCKYLGLQLIDE